jgi:hypothetical protein
MSDEHLWAECTRFGLSAYMRALLSAEVDQLRPLQAEMAAAEAATATTEFNEKASSWTRVNDLLLRIGVLVFSAYSWSQLQALQPMSREMDLTSVLHDSMHRNRAAVSASRSGVLRLADIFLLLPCESLRSLVRGAIIVPEAAAVASESVLRDSGQAPVRRVVNAALFAAVVLILPSLLMLWQDASLSRLRDRAAQISRTMADEGEVGSSGSNDDVGEKVRNNAARVLLRAYQLLQLGSSVKGTQSPASTHGWTTDGPYPSGGLVLNEVTATQGGKVVINVSDIFVRAGALKDVSL